MVAWPATVGRRHVHSVIGTAAHLCQVARTRCVAAEAGWEALGAGTPAPRFSFRSIRKTGGVSMAGCDTSVKPHRSEGPGPRGARRRLACNSQHADPPYSHASVYSSKFHLYGSRSSEMRHLSPCVQPWLSGCKSCSFARLVHVAVAPAPCTLHATSPKKSARIRVSSTASSVVNRPCGSCRWRVARAPPPLGYALIQASPS